MVSAMQYADSEGEQQGTGAFAIQCSFSATRGLPAALVHVGACLPCFRVISLLAFDVGMHVQIEQGSL